MGQEFTSTSELAIQKEEQAIEPDSSYPQQETVQAEGAENIPGMVGSSNDDVDFVTTGSSQIPTPT